MRSEARGASRSERMSNAHTKPHRPFIGRMVRILSLPIVVFWVLVAVGLGILTPSLDAVAATRSVPLSPTNSESYQAMLNIGSVTDHALITWLSCTARVADHAVIT